MKQTRDPIFSDSSPNDVKDVAAAPIPGKVQCNKCGGWLPRYYVTDGVCMECGFVVNDQDVPRRQPLTVTLVAPRPAVKVSTPKRGGRRAK